MSIWWLIVPIYVTALGLFVYLLWRRGKNKPPRSEAENQEEIEYIQEYQKKHKR